MSSLVLSTLYNLLGSVTRPITWRKQVGHSLSRKIRNQEFKTPEDTTPLSFNPIGTNLVKNACHINPANHTRLSPLKVVLADKDGEYTTDDILTKSLRLGYALQRECRVKPGDRVAITTMSEREMIECFLGVQAAGAVPVPINFVNPPKTVAYMLYDSGAKTLIVGRDDRLVAGAKRLSNFGFVKNVISVRSNVDPCFYNYNDFIAEGRDSIWPDNLKHPTAKAPAVVFYTSGTGLAPRGIVYSYEQIADGTDRVTKRHPFQDDDVIFFPVPFYHLAGFISFVGAMNAGTKLVLSDIPRYKEPKSIKSAVDMAVKHNITVFPCAPLIGEAVIDEVLARNELLPKLRLIFSGGAPMTRKLVSLVRELNNRRVSNSLPPVELHNFYAATEFGSISSAKIDLEAYADYRKILGVPFDGVEGRCNAKGIFEARTAVQVDHYLNRPELQFKTPDGFIIIGDRIEINNPNNNGEIELKFNGRDRGSLNIHGNEVSPEISQEAIVKMTGVDNACVFGIVDPVSEGHIMCALVISDNGEQMTAKKIDDELEQKGIPKRMRPLAYMFENRVPEGVINGSSKMSPKNAATVFEFPVRVELAKIRNSDPDVTLPTLKPFELNLYLSS